MENKVTLKKATLISGASKYINAVFMFIINMILARILEPDDYGIVAVTSVFSILFSTFSDMGLSSGIIQDKSLKDDEINDIFSFSFLLSVFLGGVFYLFSYPISSFYHNNIYIRLGFILSFACFFNSLCMVPNAILLKNKQFLVIGARNVITCFVSYGISIIFALNGFGFYALVYQSLLAAIINFLISFIYSRKWSKHLRLKKRIRFESIKKIVNYSFYNFGFDLVNYFVRNLDNILTGKVMGNASLGYYNKAYSLMLYPVTYLSSVVTSVIHPILSDYQNDVEFIWEKYKKTTKLMSLIGMFVTIYCIFASKEIVYITFGPKWKKSIVCVSILGVSVWFQMVGVICDGIYKSLGKAQMMFKTAIVYMLIQIILIICGCFSKNLQVLSFFVSVSYVIRFYINTYILIKKGFNKNPFFFYLNFVPEMVVGIVCGLIIIWIGKTFSSIILVSAIQKFILCLVVFYVGYCMFRQNKYIKNK